MIDTAVLGSLQLSTEAVDVYSRQTRKEWEKRAGKAFRKEHDLKENIFSKAFDPGLLPIHRISGKFVFFTPCYFPFLSLPPHTLKKFISKRPVFLIALNYLTWAFSPHTGLTTDACETVSETSVSDWHL